MNVGAYSCGNKNLHEKASGCSLSNEACQKSNYRTVQMLRST